ncbi:hypothetical protein PFTANZ_05756 [Plasmodium falciparum Tanzania (2000708)]|uniref:Uncharacterized protein n=1 Tax=Plasmodium falciparum Tanzania (2000708) TaxID=1036725 RepID=A0A024VYW9_PLAFA|nr:hypothetical protein PFTANZ_05756 [Plasmodium falciparum Tanzania (2000708)]
MCNYIKVPIASIKTKNSISNINVIWKIISKKNHIIYQYCNELYNNHIYFLKLRRTRNNA